ncbi:NAD(P)/FAD-dependent oxidoreductase [Bailinhaonella thermotolerans]|uniref:FAD-dependent oxidoreductase n=1 Tax=Bailinhaonella thermotolerans TaxID=1070861 RepID=A0A3A4AZJ7_9ACTN|nr:NAD(P)/FAD-dependent oxidoreductase [Bailinhaonella thermotolerans]RJL36112.1 FAD-dependent oxidoreductase [Bailinhaonella thermotolerans]
MRDDPPSREFDVVVIGGGPAGMAAAGAAARRGARVALVDAGPAPGGQYFRRPAAALARAAGRAAGPAVHDAGAWRGLVAGLAGVEWLGGHRVWAVEAGFAVHCLRGERERVTVAGRRLVIASGAHERVAPFPGWDLPGVMTAGGAQALLKGQLVVPPGPVIVAGTGPFLLPVGAGLAAAGADVRGVFEANALHALSRHATAVPPAKVAEAARYAYALARRGVPYRGRTAVIAAHGDGELSAVTLARVDADWRAVPGTERRVPCATLAVGHGFTPQAELALALGCATRTDPDGAEVVAVDAGMRTSVPGVFAAGEVTGIGGARLSMTEGEIAGLGAAHAYIPDRFLRRRARLARFAAALRIAYPVRDGWREGLRPDTVVCRCEEVTAAAIGEAVELGAGDARSAKLLSRAGMGWCQGRMCGYAVARLAGGPSPAGRPVAHPIRLGDLAAGASAAPGPDRAERAASRTAEGPGAGA